MLTLDMSIGEMVSQNMARASVFERHGIDCCCGGTISLREACERRGLDPARVLAELQAADEVAPAVEKDWRVVPATELIEHLVSTHHRYLRETLTALVPLMQKVHRVHGPNHPELTELAETYFGFVQEMEQHLDKEENVLFPICRQIEAGEGPQVEQMRQFVPQPMRVMKHEHETADRDLTRMRELTNGFTPPEGACGSYQRLFATLAAIEADTRVHMHKENEILFPKVLGQAAALN